jgi:sterol desaturase/sphingolipid hydroxylase (fatty acid hydroxylase superfamily)
VIYVAAFVAVFFFILTFEKLGIVRVSSDAVRTSRSAVGVMQDRTLDDDEKERRMRSASLELVKTFLSIAARSVLALAAAIAPLLVFDAVGLASFAAVTGWLSTWSAILLTTLLVTAGYYLRHRLRPRP